MIQTKKAAKISALSSGNLDSYEPSTAKQTKFDYCPLSTFFNKGLKEEEKKKGLLKRLKNTEDKNEEHLKKIKDKIDIKLQLMFLIKI